LPHTPRSARNWTIEYCQIWIFSIVLNCPLLAATATPRSADLVTPEQIADLTARSPLGRHLDWHAQHLENDAAQFRMPFAEHNVTAGNMVHGGAISALADAAATAACWATPRAGADSRGATVALSVNFLRAALGVDLVANARVVQRGGSLCVADVEVRDDAGALIALARATYKLSHGTRS
jgi:uncharacterized protein (TIGR00369 family)